MPRQGKLKTTVTRLTVGATLVSMLAGCTTPYGRPDYTANGALIGGASGAAIGAMADRRSPGTGALIGGVAGLITGGIIGNSLERRERPAPPVYYSSPPVYYSPPPAVPLPPPPSVADIKAMSRSGVSDDLIINQIDNTHGVYNLDANALIDLNNSGVSPAVISHMINSGNALASQPPPPPREEVIYVSPGPEYTWVGGEWVWSGGVWVWVGGRWCRPAYGHRVWVGARWEHGSYGWRRSGGYWR